MTTTDAPPTSVDRFLAAVEAGDGAAVATLYAEDAVLDATVPGWRFTRRGPAAIATQYAQWFDRPARLEEVDRRPTPTGEVVRYLQTLEVRGVPHAAHHCHLLTFDRTGLIARDVFFCGGRWDAGRLAEMEAAAHDG